MHPETEPRRAFARPLDAATQRRLLIHECRVHALPGRQVRDLGDAVLLTDPDDAEPFWNRFVAIRWPSEPDAFDRRLTELLIQFAALGRQPHGWPSPSFDTPSDVVERLAANGFRVMSRDHLMVLAAPEATAILVDRALPAGVTVERLSGLRDGEADRAAATIVPILVDAFDVDPGREAGVAAETVASLRSPEYCHYLVRLDGEPAAVARRATFDGLSYLSSIGTLTTARGRGLGEAATVAAAADAIAAGSEQTYLGVHGDNEVAVRLYRRVGFEIADASLPDMLLVG